MATLYDLFQRQLEPGDAIILKNIEAQPLEIVEIGDLAVQPHPTMPPQRQLKCLVQVTIMQPFEKPFIDGYIVKKGEKKLGTVQ